MDKLTTPSDPNLQGSFKTVIAAGVPVVMVALATYLKIDPDHLAAFSPTVINQLLRKQLGFGGVVMSDDIGATEAVSAIPPATRGVEFIAAGGDMIISKTRPGRGYGRGDHGDDQHERSLPGPGQRSGLARPSS